MLEHDAVMQQKVAHNAHAMVLAMAESTFDQNEMRCICA